MANIYRTVFYYYPPYIVLKKVNGVQDYGGALPNVLREALKGINGSLLNLPIYNLTTGLLKPDGNWTGILGLLQTKQVDVLTLGVTYHRNEYFKMSVAVHSTGLNILGGAVSSEGTALRGILSVFDIWVWIGLFVAMTVLVIVSSLEVQRRNGRVQVKAPTRSLYYLISIYIAALFLEGTPRDPMGSRARFLYALWWLTMLVLANAFCGHFRATMMHKMEGFKVKNLEHLAASLDRVQPVCWAKSVNEECFQLSNTEHYKKIYQALLKKDGLRNITALLSKRTFKELSQGKVALIFQEEVLKAFVGSMCSAENSGNLYFGRETFFPHQGALAFNKDFDDNLMAKINKKIRRIVEANMFQKWLDEETGNYEKCFASRYDTAVQKPLSMEDMSGLFLMHLVPPSAAVVAVLTEVLHYVIVRRHR